MKFLGCLVTFLWFAALFVFLSSDIDKQREMFWFGFVLFFIAWALMICLVMLNEAE